ncbi:hypothetical protein [Budvicia aquatica]|uniref:Uncharacterized protein n=1 Tax=Budvicia aquatica TaxID=82979 RepID=A0A484ZEI4_9GAMM|nr:hypothetical protein [Budvicia aquatica]VFS46927.1 Uncharacterised protein [Budvicia aquatica]
MTTPNLKVSLFGFDCIDEKLEDKYGQVELLRINALSLAPFLEDGAQFAMQCVKSA